VAEDRARLVRRQVAAMLRDVEGLVPGVAAALVSTTDGAEAALLGHSRNEAVPASEATVRGGGDGGGDVASVGGGSGNYVADSHSGDNGGSDDNSDNGGGLRRAGEGDGGGVSSVPAVVSGGTSSAGGALNGSRNRGGVYCGRHAVLGLHRHDRRGERCKTAERPARDELAVAAQSQPLPTRRDQRYHRREKRWRRQWRQRRHKPLHRPRRVTEPSFTIQHPKPLTLNRKPYAYYTLSPDIPRSGGSNPPIDSGARGFHSRAVR